MFILHDSAYLVSLKPQGNVGSCFKEDANWVMGHEGSGVNSDLDTESKGGDRL